LERDIDIAREAERYSKGMMWYDVGKREENICSRNHNGKVAGAK
jgi:hypothetical protein